MLAKPTRPHARAADEAVSNASAVNRDKVSSAAYLPITENVKSVRFKWARGCSAYKLLNNSVIHKGGGIHPYRPVLGDLLMAPNTGKYFYEIRVNTDNFRIGVCTASAYPTEQSLEQHELGTRVEDVAAAQCNGSQSYLESIGAVRAPDRPVVAYLNGQTSRVYVNGLENKYLWRLFVPASGGVFAFVVDTDEGVVQLFVDRKYAGLVFDTSAGLKGLTLQPCVGLAGFDMNNRSIGQGIFSATISPPQRFDGMY